MVHASHAKRRMAIFALVEHGANMYGGSGRRGRLEPSEKTYKIWGHMGNTSDFGSAKLGTTRPEQI